MEERLIKVGITHGDINGIGYEAVSYTHLDVYKRQVYGLQMAIVLEPFIARFVDNEALIVLIQSIICLLYTSWHGRLPMKKIRQRKLL